MQHRQKRLCRKSETCYCFAIEMVSSEKVYEKMTVAEMTVSRWISAVLKKDRISNELIRGTVKVAEITLKMQEKTELVGTCDEKR